jgi:aminoglycoside phosphotransferase (APT) family kinase protein
MKENWPRQVPVVALDAAAVARLVLPLFPGDSVRNFVPVGGGLTNTNYKVTLARRSAPLLLRLYQRGVAPAQKEMAIDSLIAPRVPVLHFFHLGEDNPVTGHPYAVLDWIDGPDLQHILPGLSQERLLAFAGKIGKVLAAIHSFTFEIFGFFDAKLNVQGPIDFDRAGMLAYLDQTLVHGAGGERLGRPLVDALIAYAEKNGDILADWLKQPCLVHGDFNAPNILVLPERDDAIAAVIDWEYALSASPAMDFGNLLRPPFEGNTAFAEAVALAYVEAGGFLPKDWQRIARLADVYSFADFLSRPYVADVVIKDARRVIAKLVAS